jgi:hypothetical protein
MAASRRRCSCPASRVGNISIAVANGNALTVDMYRTRTGDGEPYLSRTMTQLSVTADGNAWIVRPRRGWSVLASGMHR